MSELLGDCRNSPEKLVQDPKRDLKAFRLTASSRVGTKRGRGRGCFIDSVLDSVQQFYGQVVQGLRPWTPKAPQLPGSGRTAIEEAGIDVSAPRGDFTQREWERVEREQETPTGPGATTDNADSDGEDDRVAWLEPSEGTGFGVPMPEPAADTDIHSPQDEPWEVVD
jgi:hypothetical protein